MNNNEKVEQIQRIIYELDAADLKYKHHYDVPFVEINSGVISDTIKLLEEYKGLSSKEITTNPTPKPKGMSNVIIRLLSDGDYLGIAGIDFPLDVRATYSGPQDMWLEFFEVEANQLAPHVPNFNPEIALAKYIFCPHEVEILYYE